MTGSTVRTLAAGLVLTVVAAGCGGTTVTQAGLHAAHESGGAQASVTRIERVQVASGAPVDVVLVRAKYCAGEGENGASIPSPGGACGFNYAWFQVTAEDHEIGFSTFLPHGAVEAVTEARRSVPVLRTFSEIPGLLARCKIPRGGPRSGTIVGLCQSNALSTLHNGDTRAEFLEHWPLSKPHGARNTSGWIVTLDRQGHVRAVHTTGPTPPQLRR
jgi:hypothetical protein